MSVRPNAKKWIVKEQIVEDELSGLTFQFEIRPDGRPQILIFGAALPYGNREILFDENGVEAAAGTTTRACRAAWTDPID